MKLKNLIAATFTPMQQDLSLNLNVIKDYASFLKQNKVNGAFVNGTTANFVSLSTTERKKVVDAWAKGKPKDFYLINHVGHNNLREAMELTSHSAEKVDAIAAIAPFYFKIKTPEQLLAYCKKISACAPNIPFYYYHLPILSGANFKMIDFIKLASQEIPNFSGIKFSENNLIDFKYCLAYKASQYDILFGIDEIFLSSLALGAQGWVGSTYNLLAPLFYEIQEAFYNANPKKAALLQAKAMRFVTLLDDFKGYNGVAKGFMSTLGIDCGPSRFPHATLQKADYTKISTALEEEEILQYTCK